MTGSIPGTYRMLITAVLGEPIVLKSEFLL